MEEKNVLEYAEVIIDRQRDKINELEKKLIEVKNNSEVLQKRALKNDHENKALRLELNRKSENNMLMSMQINKENELIEKVSLLEKQLLKRDTLLEELNNLLKKRKYEYSMLLQEKEKLINTINTLRSDICKNRNEQKKNDEQILINEKQNDNFFHLYQNTNEELHVTKRCLIQIEGELNLYKKQNENQKNEIQKLHQIITTLNKEKILSPPVVLAIQNNNEGALQKNNIKNYEQYIREHLLPHCTSFIKNESKLTTLKALTTLENDLKNKLVYDKNFIKLNEKQLQEQKIFFNKILDTLDKMQTEKNKPIIHNAFDFFYTSFVLHFSKLKKNKKNKSKQQIIDRSTNSSSNIAIKYTQFSDDDDDDDDNSSWTDLTERENHASKRKSGKIDKCDKRKKKEKNTQLKNCNNKKNKKLNKKNNYKNRNTYPNNSSTSDNSYHNYSDLSNESISNGVDSTDELSTKEVTIDEITTDETNTDMFSSEECSTDEFSTDKFSNDKVSSDVVSTEELSTDNASDNITTHNQNTNKSNNASNHARNKKYKFLKNKNYDKKSNNKNSGKKKKINKKRKRKMELLNYKHYNERFIGINRNDILIYNTESDEEPVYIIRNENVKGIKIVYNNKVYIIKHVLFDNKIEIHYFLMNSDDKALRMFYALQYAGFIQPSIKNIDEYKKYQEYIKTTQKNNRNMLQLDTNINDSKNLNNSFIKDIKVNIFTPNGIDINKNAIPCVCNHVVLNMDILNNKLLLYHFDSKEKVALNCEDYSIKYKNNRFFMYFNDSNDQHIIIPKHKDDTKCLYNLFKKMNWKSINDKNEFLFNEATDNEQALKNSNKLNLLNNTSPVKNYSHETVKDVTENIIDSNFDEVNKLPASKGNHINSNAGDDKISNSKYLGSGNKQNDNNKKKSSYLKDSTNSSSDINSSQMIPENESEYKSEDESEDKSKLSNKNVDEYEKISDESDSSSKKEDTFLVKGNNIFISKTGKPFKGTHTNYDDKNYYKFTKDNLKVLQDDINQELTFIVNPLTYDEEIYVFYHSKKSNYNKMVSALKNGGFDIKTRQSDKKLFETEVEKKHSSINDKLNEYMLDINDPTKGDKAMQTNQVVVIEKGQLLIYKDYGNENAVPIMKFTSDFCDVKANETTSEITIKDLSLGTNEQIILDCLDKNEFNRWKNALYFGGFLKDTNISDSNNNASFNNNNYINLVKHIFHISLVNNLDIKTIISIDEEKIYIYINDSSNQPLFSFNKDKLEYLLFHNLRKIRLYLQRDTLYEQRYDIIIPLSRDFIFLAEKLEKFQYYPINNKKTIKIKKPFVLCTRNIISIHKDKYTLKPDLVLKRKNCTITHDRKTLTINIDIKNPQNPSQHEVKTITFTNMNNFNKWVVTLKLSMFLEGCENFINNPSYPVIIFGHVCPEATALIKKKLRFKLF
ncbi:conserved protein, unknown function [Hepatocystis sp. ex Piliocolobus tephrosceles]|nr:conserved protein, unknown function [Hepatocystis sp. ex Piliocolobus tephrosceles]